MQIFKFSKIYRSAKKKLNRIIFYIIMHILTLNNIQWSIFYIMNKNAVFLKNRKNLSLLKKKLNNITFYASLCNYIL